MPIYEYRCASCGHQQEFLQKVTDPAPRRCAQCGQEALEKMVTAAGFQLKGSGWYATDFKGGGQKPQGKPEGATGEAKGDAKSDAKGDAKGDSKSDAKSDAAKPAAPASGGGAGAATQ
jgi:putative FmdB family regulatory protein